jgi:NarL family two-component system response regulator LiaR
MQKKIRVLVADDHSVVRSGLRLFMLAFSDLELVGEAENGNQAIEFCRLYEPDVVLMDLMMPDISGVEATHEISTKFPKTKVLVLTSFPEQQLVHDAISAGAIGYMLKTATAQDLVDAIRSAARGQSTFSPEAEKALLRKNEVSTYHQALTNREWEVFRLLIEGKSNTEISKELMVGVSTVKYHVSNILSKLGVRNRSEVIAYAVLHRLIE